MTDWTRPQTPTIQPAARRPRVRLLAIALVIGLAGAAVLFAAQRSAPGLTAFDATAAPSAPHLAGGGPPCAERNDRRASAPC